MRSKVSLAARKQAQVEAINPVKVVPDIHEKCHSCAATAGHVFECPLRPKGTAPVEQIDWQIIEALITLYAANSKP